MNVERRCKMLKAMDMLVRACNDESIVYHWLTLGVADGDAGTDKNYGDLEDYTDDETFAECMEVFLDCMSYAKQDGGLYIDDVVSKMSDE